MRVLLVCEISGGHIFPALVWAEKLTKEFEVYFFATSEFLKTFLEKEGFAVYGKSFLKRNLFWEGFYRFFESIYLLCKLRPQKLIGFGGRDSFFLILFGSVFGLDTALYEPNAKLGRANRILSLFVRTVFCGVAKTMEGKKVKIVGVPLRKNLTKIDKPRAKDALGFNECPVIMCFGGSSGSDFINRTFLKLVQDFEENFQIIHLTGRSNYFEIRQLYNKIGKKKFIKDFHYAMEELYACADLVICRSGASTLAEIAYYGIPSVLITHPGAGLHQKENALYFKRRGAAEVFYQDNFNFEEFKAAVKKLLYDSAERGQMQKNLGQIKWAVPFEEFAI